MQRRHASSRLARQGSIAILCAAAIVPIVVFAVISVDIGWMVLANSQLQANADNATRAALQSYTEDTATAPREQRIRRAQFVGKRFFEATNVIDQKPTVDADDFEFGVYRNGTFLPNAAPPTAVRLNLTQSSRNGYPLLLAFVLGKKGFNPGVRAITAAEPVDIVLLIDASRSMARIVGSGKELPIGVESELDPPANGSRWRAVVDEVGAFLVDASQQMPAARVSLVVLGGGSHQNVVTPWDNNPARPETDFASTESARPEILRCMSKYTRQALPHGTNLVRGLFEAIKVLRQQSDASVSQQAIVLLSDGQQSDDVRHDPMTMVHEAKSRNIKIHTVYFSGNRRGKGSMRRYADATGGIATVANTEDELSRAFRAIVSQYNISLVE